MDPKPDNTRKTFFHSILIGVLVWGIGNLILFPVLSFLIFTWLNTRSTQSLGDVTMTSFFCAAPLALVISLMISYSIGNRIYRRKSKR